MPNVSKLVAARRNSISKANEKKEGDASRREVENRIKELSLTVEQLENEIRLKDNALAETKIKSTRMEIELELATDQTKKMAEELRKEQHQNEQLRAELARYQSGVDEIVKKAVTKARAEFEDVHFRKVAALENELNEMKLLSPSPGRVKYSKLASQAAKRVRFDNILNAIEAHVGKDCVDQFMSDFILFVSKSDQFSFSLRLTPWQSFYASVRFGMTDTYLRDLKSFLAKSLSFDVFSSRHVIDAIRKKSSSLDDYTFKVEKSEHVTKHGRKIETLTATVAVKNPVKKVVEKLERLAEHDRLVFDEGTSRDIVLGLGGDKGGSETKLCLLFENVEKPNDANSLLILGFYTGSDDHASLKTNFGGVFEQLNAFKTVTYNEKGRQVTRNVQLKLLGDCKFVSAVLGHSGQSSSFPCFLCHKGWSNSGKNKALVGSFDFETAGPPRTLLQALQTGKPLLHVEPKRAGPPPHHSVTGIAQAYVVDWLLALCTKLDYEHDVLPVDLKKQRKYLSSLRKEKEFYVERAKATQKCLERMSAADEVYKKKEQSARGGRRESNLCEAHVCINSMIDKRFADPEIFVCSICRSSHHIHCGGYYTDDEIHRVKGGRGACLDCRVGNGARRLGLSERREYIARSRMPIVQQYDNDADLLDDVDRELDDLEAQLEKSAGPTRQKLESALRKIGCDSRVWYQQLTGNQVRTMLQEKNIDELLSCFPDSDELKTMKAVMMDLCVIMRNADNKLKTVAEIDALEETISHFVDALRSLQPNAGVTFKLHLVTSHLIPFMRENHSWGRLSEQGIESLHAIWNRTRSRYAAVRDPVLNAHLMLQHVYNLNMIFDCGDSWNH